MIDIKDLSISYGEKNIIENCTLRVERGSTAVLTGPSGCGKTSLLRAAAGLIKPSGGSISTEGRISCVFQEPRLFPWLTLRQNIELTADRDGPSKVSRLLETLGLLEAENALPSELSGGMKQRAAICRALAFESGILLLDEPLNSLDPEMKLKTVQLIKKHSLKSAVLLVTHSEEEAKLLGGRIFRFRNKSFYEKI